MEMEDELEEDMDDDLDEEQVHFTINDDQSNPTPATPATAKAILNIIEKSPCKNSSKCHTMAASKKLVKFTKDEQLDIFGGGRTFSE